MANQLLDMSKVRKVLQLHHKGKSKLFISRYLSLSRNTVKKYIALFQLLDLNMVDISSRSDADLEEIFSNSSTNILTPKLKTLYSFLSIHGERIKEDWSNQTFDVGRILRKIP